MHRAIHALIGLAAATAVVTAAAPAASATSGDGIWGRYYSKYSGDTRAYSEGKVYLDDNGRLVVGGKLYAKRARPGLCGYVQVAYEDFEPEDRGIEFYSAKYCSPHGFRRFRFAEFGAGTARLRVCYTDSMRGRHACSKWHYIYE